MIKEVLEEQTAEFIEIDGPKLCGDTPRHRRERLELTVAALESFTKTT